MMRSLTPFLAACCRKYVCVALSGLVLAAASFDSVQAQGMHFSQYTNAPLLLNPANTALLPDASYRAGVHYRQQWKSIPAPYTTVSAFGDFQLMRTPESTNWLGVGLAFWDDKAGTGQLQQTRADLYLAYHLKMGVFNMISFGASVGRVQRKVDFTKYIFDEQWDGFKFDTQLPAGEPAEIRRTNYTDLGVGLNYAFFPNERFYLKIGGGLAHLNRPQESFYGVNNPLGLRPTGNVDAVVQVSPNVILNPSVYYTHQKTASELVYGMTVNTRLGNDNRTGSLIVGTYHRWNEALVGAIGYELGNARLISSYDYTLSDLKTATHGQGAFEISLIYKGRYPNAMQESKFSCPRF